LLWRISRPKFKFWFLHNRSSFLSAIYQIVIVKKNNNYLPNKTNNLNYIKIQLIKWTCNSLDPLCQRHRVSGVETSLKYVVHDASETNTLPINSRLFSSSEYDYTINSLTPPIINYVQFNKYEFLFFTSHFIYIISHLFYMKNSNCLIQP
jgi:hypothetical protein